MRDHYQRGQFKKYKAQTSVNWSWIKARFVAKKFVVSTSIGWVVWGSISKRKISKKKKLGRSWGGWFTNLLSFLKMAANTPPPFPHPPLLTGNKRPAPYMNCNPFSLTFPVFENQILSGLTGKQFYKRMVFPKLHLPVAHNPTHLCYQNWKAYWQTEAGPMNTNQMRSYHWQIYRGREGADPLWSEVVLKL